MTAAAIQLVDFLDFSATVGPPRVTKVKELKGRDEYHPAFDFYKPLREAIQSIVRDGSPVSSLSALLPTLTDEKKIKNYPALISKYEAKPLPAGTWFDPPIGKWVAGELTVRVNPDIGLTTDKNLLVVKLYFKSPALTPSGTAAMLYLMRESLDLDQNTVPAILDLRTGRLHRPRRAQPDPQVLLAAEAAAFMSIWNAL